MKAILVSQATLSAIAIAARLFEVAGTQTVRSTIDQDGMVEIYGEIAYFAEVSAKIVHQACLNNVSFTGCYAYDVDEAFGEYLAEVCKHGSYTKETAEDKLFAIAKDYFLLDESNRDSLDYLVASHRVPGQDHVLEAKKSNGCWNLICLYDENLKFKDVYNQDKLFEANVNKLFAVGTGESLHFDTIKSMKEAALERIQTLGWPTYASYFEGLQYANQLKAKISSTTILVA